MAIPRNDEEFLTVVRKSRLVEEARLNECLQRLKQTGAYSSDIGKLAGLLLREGLLTVFHSDQLVLGKHRGFFLGGCTVLERLGTGMQGSVYLCWSPKLERVVAVKVLPAAAAGEAGAVKRFQLAAQAMTRLDHPNLTRALELGVDGQLHFLVMDYVDGSTLAEVVKKTGRMDPVRAANYVSQAAHGLFHAYVAGGVIHREIEPTNVMLHRHGKIRVIDFGLARSFFDEPDLVAAQYDATVQVEEAYAAPELLVDIERVDPRADIFALGAVLYFLLSGQAPSQPVKPIGKVRPDVPPEIAYVVERMMIADREERYQTPVELIEALSPWSESPIPLPTKEEMPGHCVAVRRLMGRET